MVADSKKPSYFLRGLHFSGLASMAIPLWYGGDDAFEIQTDARHRMDFEVVDGHDGINFVFEGRAYNNKLDYDPMADFVPCTQVEGLQLLATIYDEYVLDCRLTGRPMKRQDATTLSAIQTLNARHKQKNAQPYVLVTQKLILPDLGLVKGERRNLGVIDERLDDYYDSFSRDYQALSKHWLKETDRKLEKYAEKIYEPVQFVATQHEERGGYQIFVIQPFGYEELDYIEDMAEVCTTLKALEAGYILPAPGQPDIVQHWAQNVHDWDHQKEGLRAVSPSAIGDALRLMLIKKPPKKSKDDSATFGPENGLPTNPFSLIERVYPHGRRR